MIGLEPMTPRLEADERLQATRPKLLTKLGSGGWTRTTIRRVKFSCASVTLPRNGGAGGIRTLTPHRTMIFKTIP